MTEADLLRRLAIKYPAAMGWAFFSHIRNGTGFLKNARTMDAFAMGTWPGRGLTILGFECKVSRVDWLGELKNPAKAEAFHGMVDQWYLVTPSDLIKPGELPANWGLIEAVGAGLRVKKEAPGHPGRTKIPPLPEDFDRLFLAALLRQVMEQTGTKRVIEDELRSAREEGKRQAAADLRYTAQQYERLKESVAAFEKAAGFDNGAILHSWTPPVELGKAVKIVLNSSPGKVRRLLKQHVEWMKARVTEAERYLEEA